MSNGRRLPAGSVCTRTDDAYRFQSLLQRSLKDVVVLAARSIAGNVHESRKEVLYCCWKKILSPGAEVMGRLTLKAATEVVKMSTLCSLTSYIHGRESGILTGVPGFGRRSRHGQLGEKQRPQVSG